jgi:hypothetical protein
MNSENSRRGIIQPRAFVLFGSSFNFRSFPFFLLARSRFDSLPCLVLSSFPSLSWSPHSRSLGALKTQFFHFFYILLIYIERTQFARVSYIKEHVSCFKYTPERDIRERALRHFTLCTIGGIDKFYGITLAYD